MTILSRSDNRKNNLRSYHGLVEDNDNIHRNYTKNHS